MVLRLLEADELKALKKYRSFLIKSLSPTLTILDNIIIGESEKNGSPSTVPIFIFFIMINTNQATFKSAEEPTRDIIKPPRKERDRNKIYKNSGLSGHSRDSKRYLSQGEESVRPHLIYRSKPTESDSNSEAWDNTIRQNTRESGRGFDSLKNFQLETLSSLEPSTENRKPYIPLSFNETKQ